MTQSGDNNDVLRLGVRARLTSLETIKNIFAKRFAYFIVIHFAQFDKLSGYNWQIEHVYRITLVPDLIFISGFLDHNILRAGNRFVGEHQFSIRLFEGLFAHVEYRSNDFMPTENTGWGIGLGYLSRF